ncbi:LOW QUALITY PROTEIN: sorting nexin-2-like, partial [Paramacrobiotus metropolitanus]|uniref:LOW QUALITY PROTEIN: sorting nexin-2-like n=1 Tax=Paramacrobiotus metropolitanus TaxID=2943436 RepID=UPI0024460F81
HDATGLAEDGSGPGQPESRGGGPRGPRRRLADVADVHRRLKISYVSDSSSSTARDRDEPFAAPKRVITKEAKEEEDKFVTVTVTVSEPQKVNEGLNAYVQYKVSTETNLAVFRRRKFSVVRRFSDFLGLHEKLQEKHVHVGRFVPPAPEKSVAGMAKVKMSKGDTTAPDGASGEFVERRRAALERFLARTAQHPVLRMDPDLREFLEMDETLPKASNTSAFSGAGVMRLFGKVGEQVTRITNKMEEKDEWFEEKTSQIDNMEMQLKKLHASVESLYHHRRDLSSATGMPDKIQAPSDAVLEKDFNDISKMIKKEMERFGKIRVKDFKETPVKYVQELMLHQEQLIKHWEAFLPGPEARSISTA